MSVDPIPTPQEFQQQYRRKTYSAILELAARHPLLSPSDIALMTGASESWVKKVMGSDSFRAQRAARVQELHGPRLAEIQAKLETTFTNVIEAINKRIADPTADCSEDTLLKAFQLLADRVVASKGAPQTLLPPPGQPTKTEVHFHGISLEDIENARRASRQHSQTLQLEAQPNHSQVIDVDADGIPTERRVRSIEGIN